MTDQDKKNVVLKVAAKLSNMQTIRFDLAEKFWDAYAGMSVVDTLNILKQKYRGTAIDVVWSKLDAYIQDLEAVRNKRAAGEFVTKEDLEREAGMAEWEFKPVWASV